jgi:hypothetical protein
VDPASANLRFALGATSAPTLRQLNGTLFALTVPPVPNATPPPSPRAETAFFVFAEQAVAPGATRDVAVLPKTAAATTGLVSSSGLTVSLAPADGLRRDGGGGGRVDDALSPQTLARAVRTMLGIRDFLKEAIQMWIEQPAPLEAALDPARLVELANRPPDMVQQAIPLPARVAAPPAVVDSIAVPVTGPTVMTEPVVAVAESHPWWLANCEKRPTENVPAETRSAEEQAVVEQPWEPSTADRVAALLTGLWLGGVALQVSAPERSTEEEKPAAPPKDKSDETEE